MLFEIFLAFFGAGGLAPIKAKAIGRVLTGDMGSALVSLRRIYFKFCGKTDIYKYTDGRMDMDSQNKNTVFSHAASCARLNECTSTAPASSLRAQLRQSCAEINSAYRLVEARFGSAAAMPSSCRWLLDNRYLALREAKRAGSALRDVRRLRAGGDGMILSALCRDMINVCSGSLTEASILEYLNGFQSVSPLPQNELYLLPAVLLVQLTAALADVCRRLESTAEPEALAGEFAALFGSVRLISELDMHSLLERADIVEKVLSADPAGIYPRMDEQSRAEYRARLSKLARREGLEEHVFAKKLIEKSRAANGLERHVGIHLFSAPNEKKLASAYISANILITLFLTLLCGFLSRSAVAAAPPAEARA